MTKPDGKITEASGDWGEPQYVHNRLALEAPFFSTDGSDDTFRTQPARGGGIKWKSPCEGFLRMWYQFERLPTTFDEFEQLFLPLFARLEATRLTGPENQNYQLAPLNYLIAQPGSWQSFIVWDQFDLEMDIGEEPILPTFYQQWVCSPGNSWTLSGPFTFGAHSPDFVISVPLGPARFLWPPHAQAVEIRSLVAAGTYTVDQYNGSTILWSDTNTALDSVYQRSERQGYSPFYEVSASAVPTLAGRYVWT